METIAKRSLSGFIQLWITIVLPPILILVYLIVISFDLSQLETTYWILGLILLATSVLYVVLFGSTLFLPKVVVEGDGKSLHIHKHRTKDDIIPYQDILSVIAVKNARMTLLRINAVKRTYGKLTIKTNKQTYHLYPIESIDEVKQQLDKLIKN